ncbi:DUF4870 domain-containing protein [Lentisphaerota bacterium WC36G]|nr:DUF4870 domain-containing protein [Lentisphaerae bacterium WC36]
MFGVSENKDKSSKAKLNLSQNNSLPSDLEKSNKTFEELKQSVVSQDTKTKKFKITFARPQAMTESQKNKLSNQSSVKLDTRTQKFDANLAKTQTFKAVNDNDATGNKIKNSPSSSETRTQKFKISYAVDPEKKSEHENTLPPDLKMPENLDENQLRAKSAEDLKNTQKFSLNEIRENIANSATESSDTEPTIEDFNNHKEQKQREEEHREDLKNFAMMLQASTLLGVTSVPFANVLGPLLVKFYFKGKYEEMKYYIMNMLNFQISFAIYYLIGYLIDGSYAGQAAKYIIVIMWIFQTYRAYVRASEYDYSYKYPFTIKFFRK